MTAWASSPRTFSCHIATRSATWTRTNGRRTPDGAPRDPWSRRYQFLLIEMAAPHGDVTFRGGSFGAQLALKELCHVYGTERHLYSDAYPVVALSTKSRMSKSYGKIVGPWFEGQGWATIEDVKAGRKKKAKATKAHKQGFDEAIGDKLPNWGN